MEDIIITYGEMISGGCAAILFNEDVIEDRGFLNKGVTNVIANLCDDNEVKVAVENCFILLL